MDFSESSGLKAVLRTQHVSFSAFLPFSIIAKLVIIKLGPWFPLSKYFPSPALVCDQSAILRTCCGGRKEGGEEGMGCRVYDWLEKPVEMLMTKICFFFSLIAA